MGPRLVHAVREELVTFNNWKISRGREKNDVIGVHLRFGDDAFAAGQISKNFTERLWGCISFLEQILAVNDATIFIASDHLNTKLAIRKKHSHRVYVSQNAPFHVDDLAANSNMSNAEHGTLVSLMELFFLSFCHGLIISDGFYGSLAGQIGMIPGQYVINVRDSRC